MQSREVLQVDAGEDANERPCGGAARVGAGPRIQPQRLQSSPVERRFKCCGTCEKDKGGKVQANKILVLRQNPVLPLPSPPVPC